MEEIKIKKICRNKNNLKITFDTTDGLKKYFKDFSFFANYDFDISPIPESVLVIPFICNVLPIVWLTNSILYIHCIDLNFYECLDSIKTGYKRMYPSLKFKGKIYVDKVEKNKITLSENKACMFSGGVDAISTVISHIDEKPELITIHGSADFFLSDLDGWEIQKERVMQFGNIMRLKNNFISSNFYEFVDGWGSLGQLVKKSKDKYWHGFQHGIGLLGLVAPIAFIKKINTLYIASSWVVNDAYVCASDPIIDNQLRFFDTRIIHDGYCYNRQEKIKKITYFSRQNSIKIPIQVCLHEVKGQNCGYCEKCIRTSLALIAEGASPSDFGIPDNIENQKLNIEFLVYELRWFTIILKFYKIIQRRFIENQSNIKDCPYKTWMLNFDFDTLLSKRHKISKLFHHLRKKYGYK